METKWTTVELLRHARHDWLNKIQLIKGNMALGKMDRVSGLVDEIIVEAQQEAKISNLNMPMLSELLLTGKWLQYTFDITYEMVDDIKGCPELDEMLTNWMKKLFDEVNQRVDAYDILHLSILLSKTDAASLKIGFDFEGKVNNKEELFNMLQVSEPLKISGITEDINSFYFEITVR
jgi:stage 0 sporulation protein B (sporulation initiation phosphotransferase)